MQEGEYLIQEMNATGVEFYLLGGEEREYCPTDMYYRPHGERLKRPFVKGADELEKVEWNKVSLGDVVLPFGNLRIKEVGGGLQVELPDAARVVADSGLPLGEGRFLFGERITLIYKVPGGKDLTIRLQLPKYLEAADTLAGDTVMFGDDKPVFLVKTPEFLRRLIGFGTPSPDAFGLYEARDGSFFMAVMKEMKKDAAGHEKIAHTINGTNSYYVIGAKYFVVPQNTAAVGYLSQKEGKYSATDARLNYFHHRGDEAFVRQYFKQNGFGEVTVTLEE
jgi:hypothetical protein